MPDADVIIEKLDELLHDPKTTAVEFYARTLRYWESLVEEQSKEQENATKDNETITAG